MQKTNSCCRDCKRPNLLKSKHLHLEQISRDQGSLWSSQSGQDNHQPSDSGSYSEPSFLNCRRSRVLGSK